MPHAGKPVYMHLYNLSSCNIVTTKHAIVRFKQRFRLHYSPVIHDKDYRHLIEYQFRQGKICTNWESVPFYYNMITSEYGKRIIVLKAPCYYICEEYGTALRILTVVPKWFCE